MCIYIVDYLREHLGLPVVPEAALGLDYKIFFIYRTCMRRAPARPVCASLCDSDALFQRSHLKLHTSHCTLHTSHFALTLHTPHFISSHLIWALLTSSPLFSPHLISSHMSSKFFSSIFHFIWALLNLSHLSEALLNSSQLFCTLTVR